MTARLQQRLDRVQVLLALISQQHRFHDRASPRFDVWYSLVFAEIAIIRALFWRASMLRHGV